jgi:hypothetical protein
MKGLTSLLALRAKVGISTCVLWLGRVVKEEGGCVGEKSDVLVRRIESKGVNFG